MSENLVILLHVGAGYFNEDNHSKYKHLTKLAINKGIKCYKRTKSIDQVLVSVIKTLEDSELTNAGFGSNLNLVGKVELDCSITKSKFGEEILHQFIGLGAVDNIKNPIELANKLKELDIKGGILPGNRVAPLLLTNKGVEYFVSKHYPELHHENDLLISDKAKREHEYYKKNLDTNGLEEIKNDTVGAIVFDLNTLELISGVSSGGILLKFPGRVGEAAIYGAGVWSEFSQNETEELVGVACSTSGTGEAIIYNQFSKTLAKNILNPDTEPLNGFETSLINFLDDRNITYRFIKDNTAVGSICLSFSAVLNNAIPKFNQVEFIFGHTAPNMGVAYYNSRKKKFKFILSEKKRDKNYQLSLINLLI